MQLLWKTMSKNFNSPHIVSLDCTKHCAHFKVEIIRALKAETIVLNFPSQSPPQQTSMWCSDKQTTHCGKRDKRLHPFRRALLITCFITKMLVFKSSRQTHINKATNPMRRDLPCQIPTKIVKDVSSMRKGWEPSHPIIAWSSLVWMQYETGQPRIWSCMAHAWQSLTKLSCWGLCFPLTTHAWTVHNSPAYPELAPMLKA